MPFDLETRLAEAWPPDRWHDVTVLLAVSGGGDSVALLRAMRAIQSGGAGRLVAAHFNHGLRGEQSDDDQAFVQQLCRSLDVPCHAGRAETRCVETHPTGRAETRCVETHPTTGCGGEGLEATLRRARYAFLRTTAAQVGARYVATGHTADDQIETILHRVLRGTGIAGLGGMARSRPLGEAATLIRPLLGFRRAELIEYLDRLGQPYRTDASNADLRFTRNRLRHKLLPLLAERFSPAVGGALLRLGTLADEVQEVVEPLVVDLADRSVSEHGDAVRIDIATLADTHRYLVRQLLLCVWQRKGWPLRKMGYAEWNDLADMILQMGPGRPAKKMFPGAVLAERNDDHLWLGKTGMGETGPI